MKRITFSGWEDLRSQLVDREVELEVSSVIQKFEFTLGIAFSRFSVVSECTFVNVHAANLITGELQRARSDDDLKKLARGFYLRADRDSCDTLLFNADEICQTADVLRQVRHTYNMEMNRVLYSWVVYLEELLVITHKRLIAADV